MAVQASAAKQEVPINIHKGNKPDQQTTVKRSPMRLPIELTYDDETRQIEIIGDDELEAEVYLCDGAGNIIDYSPVLNAVLEVPTSYTGRLVVRIENDDWTAIGEIRL